MRRLLLLSVTVIVLALPAVAGAEQDPARPTETPGAAPASADGAETAISVGDEAAYLAALATLSADGSGPHTMTLTADIILTTPTDPVWGGSQALTIDGQGQFFLSGGNNSRVLAGLTATELLTLRDLTVKDGSTSLDGGGVRWAGPVTLERAVLRDNTVSATNAAFGGALSSGGDVTITDSQLIDNTVQTNGAFNANGGAVNGDAIVMTGSTATGNRARLPGACRWVEHSSATRSPSRTPYCPATRPTRSAPEGGRLSATRSSCAAR